LARLIDLARFIGGDTDGHHILRSPEAGIRFLTVLHIEFVIEALLMTLSRSMNASMRLPSRVMIARKVDIHVSARAATDTDDKKKITAIADRNSGI